MTISRGQVPPFRLPAPGAQVRPPRPFVPVVLEHTPRSRRKRHWLARTLTTLAKFAFGVLCLFVALVVFCVTYHQLTLPR